MFLKKSATELLKHSNINKHSIDIKKGKQLLYKPICSFRLLELETFKTYIKINLANSFI